MDGASFDRMATRFGKRHSRRALAVGLGAAGASRIAPGHAQVESQARIPSTCRDFSISGGRSPRENFNYDDDMRITLTRQNGQRTVLLRDNDGEIGQGNEDVPAIRFSARVGDELKIVVRDRQAPCFSMEPLFLHCCTNAACLGSRASRRIAKRIKRTCPDPWRRRVFFNETIEI